MTTFVGKQSNFADAVKELIELEYDAVAAYREATGKLKNSAYSSKLSEFRSDHERHIKELTRLLSAKHKKIPTEAGPKQWLTKGKVIIAGLVDDKAVLMAMRSNEIDTNTAYERMLIHEDIWPEALNIIKDGLADEKKHKAWLEEQF